MPWNLLILPLAGGYYILSRLNRYKFVQQRLDRQRLIFDSILFGIALLVFSFILRYFINAAFPVLIPTLYSYFPIKTPFIGTASSSLLIAVITSLIGNKTFCKNRQHEIELAIKKVGNELELLLKSSFADSILLEISLDTDKVYVVWVKELPIPSVTNFIRVIPVFSGFRDDEKRLVFTTHYTSIYSEYIKEGKIKSIEELDIDLVINLDNIVNVSYFDIDMYERFNNSEVINTDELTV